MLQRAARNAYSWWWASHVRTKQSKWLEDNLQDMEEKVEYILKIIDEDGDTFAQRAEMYYRKRPEIVNFVEDSFRGYRALAERYDHLSRELQSANRTIATVFPESVQLSMEDTDDFDKGNLPRTMLPPDEFSNNTKNPPAPPQLAIPKFPSFARKESKKPSRLMSRKGLIKVDAKDAIVVTTRSGLKKSEALQRIDELQKEILSLQTEKEFVRSSYEKGIERYGEIEKQITEMQEEVSNLQDEFGIGTVIEDDEARSIMTATALKSCQETLKRLLQKQEQSAEDARQELQRIQEAQQKMKSLKQKHADGKEEQEQVGRSFLSRSIEHDVHDQESLRKKVMEDLRLSLGTCLTTSELAEKVDELVDKIIKLETAVSSHGAYVQRLRSETKEFNAHLQCFEVEKETSNDGAKNMSKKITELEEELQRIQRLNQDMNKQNYSLQNGFAEASCNIDDLYEKLQHVKPDEETDMITPLVQGRSVSDVQELVHVNNVSNTKKAKKDGNVGHSDTMLPDPTSNDICSPKRSQLEFTTGDLNSESEECSIKNIDQIGPASGSRVSHCHQQEANEHSTWIRSSSEKDSEHHFFLSDRQNSTDNIRAAESINPEEGLNGREDGFALEYDVELRNEASKQDSTGIVPSQQGTNCLSSNDSSRKSDQGSVDYPYQGNHKSQQIEGEAQSDLTGSLEKKFKEQAVEVNTENSFLSNTKVQYVNGGAVVSCEGREDKKGKVFVQNSISLAEDHHPQTVVVEDKSTEEEKNGIHILPSPIKVNGSIRQDNSHRELNHASGNSLLKISQLSEPQQTNPAQGMTVTDGFPTVLTSDKMEENMEKHSLLNDETDKEQMVQNGVQTAQTNFTTELDETVIEEDKSPNWKELLLSGLDDRQQILLEEYTSILRNYKEARKKLSEVEKKNRASAFRYCIQIKVLESSNALKDAKIQSLQKKLSLLQDSENETPESMARETTNLNAPEEESLKIHQNLLADFPNEATNESVDVTEETTPQQQKRMSNVEEDGNTNVINVNGTLDSSIIEEKIRADIDELVEENIEFWMKFSTSFQQIQKFTTVVQDLQAEIAKVKAKKEQDKTDHLSVISEIRPIYRHLSEIQTELILWLDQNDVLKDDLHNRLSSISSIEEEITRLPSDNSTVETSGISDYQAAKFQGEILNMKHENNRVGDELQSGLKRVRNLQVEIEKTLGALDKEFGISTQRQQSRYTAVRTRIPLRSFLFGVKLKKQKQKHSFFACMNPVLQKKYSDLSALPP